MIQESHCQRCSYVVLSNKEAAADVELLHQERYLGRPRIILKERISCALSDSSANSANCPLLKSNQRSSEKLDYISNQYRNITAGLSVFQVWYDLQCCNSSSSSSNSNNNNNNNSDTIWGKKSRGLSSIQWHSFQNQSLFLKASLFSGMRGKKITYVI